MPPIEIRPFRRDDRDQLTGLVNMHVAAVIPGVVLSVNAVMSQLEREPGEAIVDPWVVERKTLVAVEHSAIAGAAHLHRYGDSEEVGPDYRNAGSIHWLLFGPRRQDVGDALMAACLATLDRWGVRVQHAGGELPCLATYGVPATWPHVRELYVRSGFRDKEYSPPYETIHVIEVDRLPATTTAPVEGLTDERSLGVFGARFSARLDGAVVGCVDVELRSERNVQTLVGWADIGNLWVAEEHRRRGIATWLLGLAADWLRLGGIERLLTYTWPSEEDELGFIAHLGFRELVRTERGWSRDPATPRPEAPR